MEAKHPQRVAALIALLAVVCLPSARSLVHAQDVVLRAPETQGPQLEATPDPLSTPDTASETFSPAPQASAPCPTCQAGGYWIVSSRHCLGHTDPRNPQCPLRFYYMGADRRLRIADQQSFVSSLNPGAPVCILVHGSFHSWESIVTGSSDLYNWLTPASPNAPENLVFFTWPSDKPNTMVLPLDFAILGRRSEHHGTYLAHFISMVPADRPISLIAHSHGARTVSAALHLRAGGEVEDVRLGRAPDLGRRIRVVFAAAAIDNTWLNPGERFGLALSGTESLVNLKNRDDAALSLYPFRRMFSGKALAKTGFTPRIRRSMGQWSARLSDIDVTRQIGTGHFWHNYFEHPEIARAIAPTVFYLDEQPEVTPATPVNPVTPPAGPQTQQTSFPVPQRRGAGQVSPTVVRETFSNVGPSRPVGRL